MRRQTVRTYEAEIYVIIAHPKPNIVGNQMKSNYRGWVSLSFCLCWSLCKDLMGRSVPLVLGLGMSNQLQGNSGSTSFSHSSFGDGKLHGKSLGQLAHLLDMLGKPPWLVFLPTCTVTVQTPGWTGAQKGLQTGRFLHLGCWAWDHWSKHFTII